MVDSQKPSEQKIDRDAMSGVETTGHEWDGIKELNIPAPRWWLLVYFVTIIWAIGYWVVYPAWPTHRPLPFHKTPHFRQGRLHLSNLQNGSP